MVTYSNAQLRSILYGLGYVSKDFVDISLGFPVTTDNSALTSHKIVQAIRSFQTENKLKVDGIVGAKTMAKAEEVMRIMQYELSLVMQADLPKDQPYYGPRTFTAVKKFQTQIGIPHTGIASRELRTELDKLAKQKV